MTLREDLIAAKAMIDTPEKWGKGKYEPRPGCYCALGAVAKVTGHDPNTAWLNGRASTCRNALYEYTDVGIASFNDAPDTTHADIMALFDRAIATAGDA